MSQLTLVALVVLAFTPSVYPVCVREYVTPICGTDGKIYADAAEFKAATKTNRLLGMRGSLEECGSCVGADNPVCGSDGLTYKTECVLNLYKSPKNTLSKFHNGTCLNACPDNFDPVCGSDNKVYSNECELLYQKNNFDCDLESMKFFGLCCGCPLVTDQRRCGTDGQFYLSDCHIECNNKLFDGRIAVSGSEVNCYCEHSDKPICGSDGNTYKNHCYLLYAIHVDLRKGLYVQNVGKCGDVAAKCPQGEALVCSDQGSTFKNICVLNDVGRKDPTVKFASNGACNV